MSRIWLVARLYSVHHAQALQTTLKSTLLLRDMDHYLESNAIDDLIATNDSECSSENLPAIRRLPIELLIELFTLDFLLRRVYRTY
jgi:hypothetical protein